MSVPYRPFSILYNYLSPYWLNNLESAHGTPHPLFSFISGITKKRTSSTNRYSGWHAQFPCFIRPSLPCPQFVGQDAISYPVADLGRVPLRDRRPRAGVDTRSWPLNHLQGWISATITGGGLSYTHWILCPLVATISQTLPNRRKSRRSEENNFQNTNWSLIITAKTRLLAPMTNCLTYVWLLSHR